MISELQRQYSANIVSVDKAFSSYIDEKEEYTQTSVKSEGITFSDFFDDKMLIIHTIRKGLPYTLFNKIKTITPFSEDDWASYLDMSKRSLTRYSNDENFLFKPIHTEKIIELVEVTNFGIQVFDSLDQFYLWLNTPSYALGSLKPIELLKDSYGKDLVMAELNRIEHGIFG